MDVEIQDIPELSDAEVIEVVSDVNASNPMERLSCSRWLSECERTESKPSGLSRHAERDFINRQKEDNLITDGDRVRGIVSELSSETVDMLYCQKLWHAECAPTLEEFHNKVGDVEISSPYIFVEGTARWGERVEGPEGEYPKVTLENIELLFRK